MSLGAGERAVLPHGRPRLTASMALDYTGGP